MEKKSFKENIKSKYVIIENKSILEKIKSKYVITNNILSFITDKTFFLKLFFYSKSLQNKFNIQLYDYIEEFLNKRIKWENYVSVAHDNDFKIYFLKNKLDKKLMEYNLKDDNMIQKIAINYLNKNCENKKINSKIELYKEDPHYSIDIFSPLFNYLLKNDSLSSLAIIIPMKRIKKHNLDKYYISKFNELNELKVKYNSLNLSFNKCEQINDLADIKINTNYIEKLTFFLDCYCLTENCLSKKFENSIFNLIQNFHNLIYLSLVFENYNTSSKSFTFINQLKYLKYLKLYRIRFIDIFTLKLSNLKILVIFLCKNIEITNDVFSNLKRLILSAEIPYKKELIKCPGLEEISSPDYEINKIIDCRSLKNIKYFNGKSKDFLLLDSLLLEEVHLKHDFYYPNDYEMILIEKLYSLKFLKIIYLDLYGFNEEEIIRIKSKNTSVTELHINLGCKIEGLYHLQNKFINLNKLCIDIKNREKNKPQETMIKIEENANSKVTHLEIEISKKLNYKIYCKSYQELESIRFRNIDEDNTIIKKILPIFNDRCDIIFRSLKIFDFFQCYAKGFNILKNIYNNIDNMPNLVEFYISFQLEDISNKFYKRFIEKVLSNKLIKKATIKFSECFEKLSLIELKKLFPKINFRKFTEINIYKLNDDDSGNGRCCIN